jgi:hypothetical protein
MTIAILWLASGFIETNREVAAKILYPIATGYIAFGIIEYLFFFLFAASISFLVGVFTLLAIRAGKS